MKYYILLVVLTAIACSPTIHYLGDSYPAKANVDVYYDEADVDRPFETMGRMTHDLFLDYNPELIQTKMIERARSVGADAIIFDNMSNQATNDASRLEVRAKLIRYK